MANTNHSRVTACPSCAYHSGQSLSAHALYNEQLLRADRLQHEVSRLTDELRATRRELNAAREERDIEQRRVARLLAEREREAA
jgi:hypothetical protein